jgi:hypothetical protein
MSDKLVIASQEIEAESTTETALAVTKKERCSSIYGYVFGFCQCDLPVGHTGCHAHASRFWYTTDRRRNT